MNKSLNAVAGESSEPDSDEESSADGGSGSSSGGSGEEEWIEEDDRRRKQRNNSSRRGTTSPRRDRCPLNRNSNAATGCGCGYSAGGGGGNTSSGGCCGGGGGGGGSGGGCCGGPSCSVRETLERETLCRALEAVDDGKMPVSEVSNLPTLKYGVPVINVSAYRPLSAFKTWEIIEILKYHMTFSV